MRLRMSIQAKEKGNENLKKKRGLESVEIKRNTNLKKKEHMKNQRLSMSVQAKEKRNTNLRIKRELESAEMKIILNENRANLLRTKRECLKDNPSLFGIARRFSIDNPYYHDVIEYFEGPLKVWCKGEKLEHDPRWQVVTAGRFSKRLSEAFSADNATENTMGFLEYVLDPQTQGYQENEWTDFKTKMKRIHRNNWTDEMYLLITKPEEVAMSKESSDGTLSLTLLESVRNNRKKIGESYQKPIFNEGPVCSCYARKFFLEISYLGCCKTNLKKFHQEDNSEDLNNGAEDGDIDDELIKVEKSGVCLDVDKMLKDAKSRRENVTKRKINVVQERIPDILLSLYQGIGRDGKFFISHANSLNQALAFCSLGANFKRWDGSNFVSENKVVSRGFNPVVTVQGKMFHRIGPIQATDENEPKFGQIYFIDADMSEQADQRMKHIKQFNVSDDQNVRTNPQATRAFYNIYSFPIQEGSLQ